MRVNIYGCGFAGIVSALGLCENGHNVTGHDVNEERVAELSRGSLKFYDEEIETLLERFLSNQLQFRVLEEKLDNPDFCLLALPTPLINKTLDVSGLVECCDWILKEITFQKQPLIIIRSTLPLGGLQKIEQQLEQKTQKISGKDYTLTYVPEFMREGTGLDDWREPPQFVVGINHGEISGEVLSCFSQKACELLTGGEAEALKLLSNAYHATKITFANEAMRICESRNISSDRVMEVFCKDRKLNISKKYLKPGFAWGGSCLGKDTRELLNNQETLPLLENLDNSNETHIQFYKDQVVGDKNNQSVSFLGLSFKENVKDFRSSPVISLLKLLEENETIKHIFIYEPSLKKQKLDVSSLKITYVEQVSDLLSANVLVARPQELIKYPELEEANIKILKM